MLGLLFISTTSIFAQLSAEDRKSVDSLKYVIASTENDVEKVEAYVDWDNLIYIIDPELDKEINESIIEICEFHLTQLTALKAKKFYQEQLASSYNILGIFYENRGVYPLALDYHTKSLDLQKELNNTKGIADSYNNLGILYLDKEQYELAEEYFIKSIKMRNELKDYSGLGNAYNNVGLIHQKKHEYPLSNENFAEGQENFLKANDELGVALIDFNMGVGYGRQFMYDTAMYYFEKAYVINKKYGAKDKLTNNLHQMAFVENYRGDSSLRTGNYQEAMKHYEQARIWSIEGIEMGKEIDSYTDIMEGNLTLVDALQGLGDFDGAGSALWDYSNAKDSLHKANGDEQFYNMQYEFEYRRKVERDSIQQAEAQKVTDAQLEKEKTQRYALVVGVIVLIIFGGFIFNRFRKSQQQKSIIEQQKCLVEEKNEEIMDSIKYAKRIQAAILPPPKIVDRHLNENFVLYLPKDVVAGDFYWLQHVDKNVYFAAADCTGHGVPGAMVSVVCNNALNRSVKEFGLRDPGKILDKTREIVIDEFSKADENVKDGMDIALCYLENKKVSFSGANNPMWIIRNNEIIELKGDKQPIGNFEHQHPFTTHVVDLEIGDNLYLFSDGIVDQFGGPKGKKFKPAGLRKLLLELQNLPMPEQKSKIEAVFNEWRGSIDQIDDLCIIGVRI